MDYKNVPHNGDNGCVKRDKKHTKAAALAESVFGDNLRNNTAFNFMAGAAKMLQALKQNKDKGE